MLCVISLFLNPYKGVGEDATPNKVILEFFQDEYYLDLQFLVAVRTF